MSGSTNNTIIGSGSDSITLNISEDQAEGQDAQFAVNVDGQQIGGLQTATASKAAGQDQTFTFQGNYAPGQHDVAVTFANNLIYPGDSGDRNLYVDNVAYDGQSVSNTTSAIYNAPLFPPLSGDSPIYGNAVFTVNDTTPIPDGAGPNQTVTPGPVSVGSGADTLVLNTSEDYYQGDAQFTVSVDGQQVGGVQTTTAIQDQGQSQEFDVHGNFGGGSHTVSVAYLNDHIGGTYPGSNDAIDTQDRNLYVMGASLNGGQAASGAPWELSETSSHDFYVTAGSNPSATASSSGLFGTNGAAATGNNVMITTASLAASATTDGSASGMSFIAPATPLAASATDGTGTDTTSPATPATDTTPALAIGGATQTPQDFGTPSAAGSTDTTASTDGSSGTWWMDSQNANAGTAMFQQS